MSTNLTGDKQRTLFAYIPDDGTPARPQQGQGLGRSCRRCSTRNRARRWSTSTAGRRSAAKNGDTVVFKVDTRTGDAPGSRAHQGRRRRQRLRVRPRRRRARGRTRDDQGRRAEDVLPPDADVGLEAAAQVASPATRSPAACFAAGQQHALRARSPTSGSPRSCTSIDLAAGTRTKIVGRDDVERRHAS